MAVARDAELETSVITNNLELGILLVAISQLRQCDAQFVRKKLEVGVGCDHRI